MYRLLIVDDEPVIVNGLVQLFQEHTQLELDVCKAYSAKEALEIAMRVKLDILVSDIRMPHKNGLQLIDEITYYWPHCRIIFLTGYSEFDYVHEALRKNVDNYILKTEGIDPIFQAVQEASSKLDEENRRRIQAEKAKVHFQIAEPLLKRELIRKVLKGEPVHRLLSEPRYEEVEFRIDVDQPAFFILGRISGAAETKTKDVAQAVQMTFINDLPSSFTCEHAVLDDALQVWLLQPDAELRNRFRGDEPEYELHWHRFISYMKGILELVQNECEELLGVHVSFGISGNLLHKWDTSGQQLDVIQSMLQCRAALGQNMVIVDIEKAKELEDNVREYDRYKQDDMKFDVIDQIHNYILEHLSGDVSLTAIAEEVHFNPSYLSRYYKQLTGHNLLEYIQAKKLEGALHLMLHTNMKLQEIATRLGFESPSYFTTFFKKKMGVSPQEYRNTQ
ncbi:DNA-binding response regulator [Paenibacillus sp. LC231]|uniref:response regulator n=1 Tax=Paenibacillus sp. LC231 TaxID=1120679 RepID=UPI0008DC79A0|nr:response regulator [Paenibacillus sp. LC231]OIB00942.1 DNA-binding response regulator [Paenibacillus sp. LC231]